MIMVMIINIYFYYVLSIENFKFSIRYVLSRLIFIVILRSGFFYFYYLIYEGIEV